MTKNIILNDRTITYELARKSVKNINLRIRRDGTVYVSADKFVPQSVIDDFLQRRADFIISALDKFGKIKKNTETANNLHVDYSKCEEVFGEILRKIYPLFQKYVGKMPQLIVRKMTSRWGSCNHVQGKITLNKRLIEAPKECIEFVVMHEFVHFIHPNHSKKFYEVLTTFMPDWKERKKLLLTSVVFM